MDFHRPKFQLLNMLGSKQKLVSVATGAILDRPCQSMVMSELPSQNFLLNGYFPCHIFTSALNHVNLVLEEILFYLLIVLHFFL